VLRRILPRPVVVALGVATAFVGGVIAAGYVFRDRHHGHPRPAVTTSAPAPVPSTR
jgi:hypothetical protein